VREKTRAGDGKADLNTVEGQPITVTERGGTILVADEKGHVAEITQANVSQSNGIIQFINSVFGYSLTMTYCAYCVCPTMPPNVPCVASRLAARTGSSLVPMKAAAAPPPCSRSSGRQAISVRMLGSPKCSRACLTSDSASPGSYAGIVERKTSPQRLFDRASKSPSPMAFTGGVRFPLPGFVIADYSVHVSVRLDRLRILRADNNRLSLPNTV
jgi:hypothetical protein